MPKIAVVGSGIAGLSAARALHPVADVVLFEAQPVLGGHAHTVDVTLPGPKGPVTAGVDTGFLVLNDRTYPGFLQLLRELGVATSDADMSFSVQWRDGADGPWRYWSGRHLGTVFAQKRHALSPRFWGMLADILRFNRLCTALAESGDEARLQQSLGDFLREHRFGEWFCQAYFLPMTACIWSCPTAQMLEFPVSTMIRFCHNHGLLQITDRPQWRTISGGSRHYVNALAAGLPDVRLATPVRRVVRHLHGVMVHTDAGPEAFDHLVMATHTDQALALLDAPSVEEQAVLGSIRYQNNHAVLHTDASVMPPQRQAWSAWNCERGGGDGEDHAGVCLHYWLNALQPLPFTVPVFETLNPVRPIAAESRLAAFDWAHPVFDRGALDAQRALPHLQGQQRTWYCGAWARYGFHEDGFQSGATVARALAKTLT